MLRIAVVGGGISGLSCCYFLKKKFNDQAQITLFEADARVGGWIQTVKPGGALFELGARSLRPKGSGVVTLQLIEELEIADQLLANAPQARLRYLWQGGKLHQMPTSLLQTLFSPLTCPFLPQCIKEMVRRQKKQASLDEPSTADESIYDFFTRHFSARFAERLIDPMMSGIYAGDIRKLSLRACCPSFYAWAKEHGSLLRGAFFSRRTDSIEPLTPFIQKMKSAQMVSFRGGMQTLIDTLEGQLEGVIQRKKRCTCLKSDGHLFTLSFDDGTSYAFDRVVTALPVKALQAIFKEDASILPLLDGFSTSSLLVLNAVWKKRVLKKEGFGYLVPSCEKQPLLGVIWDSSAFPWHNETQEQTRLTLMMGGSHRPDLIELDDDSILKLALKSLKSHLQIEETPDQLYLHRALEAIPQYTVGHLERVERLRACLKQKLPHLDLIGSSFDGVSVNDCIKAARFLA